MKWLYFVLSLLASSALATTEPSSTEVFQLDSLLEELVSIEIVKKLSLKYQIRLHATSKRNRKLVSDVIAEQTKEDFKFLDRFIGHNQEIQIDEEIVTILVRDHGVKEPDARKAVELARKNELDSFYRLSYVNYLEVQLAPLLRFEAVDAQQVYKKALAKVESEKPKELRISEVYNDDRGIDLLFSVLLIKAKNAAFTLSLPQFELYVQNALLAVEENPTVTLAQHLDHDAFQAFSVWKIVQKARQTIKREISELNTPYTPNRNVDTRMIELLKPLLREEPSLRQFAEKDEVEQIMRDARVANTFERAAKFIKQYAIWEILESPLFLRKAQNGRQTDRPVPMIEALD